MTADREIPAILGGAPVRTAPWAVGPMIDGEEERLVVEAIRAHNFSRYIGSTSPDIQTLLRMPSRDTRDIQAEWHFLGGENVRLFGAEFAEAFGVDFAIPINSATTGLSVALAAAGISSGDEVICPALSFTATGSSILLFNSIPVFVDVDPRSFCISPAAIEAAITPRTKAIIVVHLLGNVADMDAILAIAERHGLKVIEDCAQAPGARHRGSNVGSMGDAGVFSFQQSKNIMTGEGGMIVTNDPEIARRARLILNHGEVVMDDQSTDDEMLNVIGCNFRMPELIAALGRAQLKKLKTVNDWRNDNYRTIADLLADEPALIPPHIEPHVDYVCHAAAFLFDEEKAGMPRDIFIAAVRKEGVPLGSGYVRLMYENPTFLKRVAYGRGCPWTCSDSDVTYAKGQCPVAESLIGERFIWLYHVSHPSTNEDMADVARAIKKVLRFAPDLMSNADSIRATGMGKRAQGRL